MSFSFLSELEHILASKDRQDADGFRFRNHCSVLYKVLVSTLAPCEIRRRDPSTSCILRSFLQFPCGTLTATILQVDNCIFIQSAQLFCLYHFLRFTFETIIQNQSHKFDHLKDVAVLLYHTTFEWTRYVRLSAFSRQAYLLYYKSLPPISISTCQGGLGIGIPQRKLEFLINSVRLAIFRSLSIPTVSELPPKLTWSRPTPITFSSARTILHHRLEEWLSHGENNLWIILR